MQSECCAIVVDMPAVSLSCRSAYSGCATVVHCQRTDSLLHAVDEWLSMGHECP